MISLALALAVDVLDVDANQGPFLEIDAAIAAASPGDVIRIAPGTYGFFQIQGKPLTLVPAEPLGTYAVGGTVRVSGIAAGEAVVMSGAVVQATPSGQGDPALIVSASAGAIRIENSTFNGGNGLSGRVLDSADVSFHDCQFNAGVDVFSSGQTGYDALEVAQSSVSLWACTLLGTSSTQFATPGGHGISGQDSQIVLQQGWVEAGDGGPENGGTFSGCINSPGPGGNGFDLLGCDLQLVGASIVPGDAGFDEICSPGVDGVAVNALRSTITEIAGDGPAFDAEPGLVTENQPLTLSIDGEPGDTVFLLLGPETGLSVIPGFFGNLAVDGPPSTVRRAFLGSVPLQVQIQAPPVAATAKQSLTLQTLHLRPGTANLFGPVRMVTVLDGGL